MRLDYETDGRTPGSESTGRPLPTDPSAKPAAQKSSFLGRWLPWVIILVVLGAGGKWWWANHQANAAKAGGDKAGQFPVPIVPGVVEKKDVPIYLDGLGTIQALNTVTVRARVDGEIKKVFYTEGQDVKAGDVLVQIDDAPFRATFEQATAKKGQDEAQAANAKLDLDRYQDLVTKKVISSQQFDTQKALVKQLDATVTSDAAAIESARVQLDYTKVVAPIDGRTGIRLVDQGNVVHATDTTGLVVLTQLRPISLLFTLPEQNLSEIHKQTNDINSLSVEAVDRDNKTVLDKGELSVIDNQIDTTTGTLKLKATFPNTNLQLWPGQFINARLLLTVKKDGLTVPAAVVQRGPQGPFVFVIKDDETVEVRPVKITQIEDGEALIADGVAEGERVVVDGQYKLQPGSHVKITDPAKPGGAGAAHGAHGGNGPHTGAGGAGAHSGAKGTPAPAAAPGK